MTNIIYIADDPPESNGSAVGEIQPQTQGSWGGLVSLKCKQTNGDNFSLSAYTPATDFSIAWWFTDAPETAYESTGTFAVNVDDDSILEWSRTEADMATAGDALLVFTIADPAGNIVSDPVSWIINGNNAATGTASTPVAWSKVLLAQDPPVDSDCIPLVAAYFPSPIPADGAIQEVDLSAYGDGKLALIHVRANIASGPTSPINMTIMPHGVMVAWSVYNITSEITTLTVAVPLVDNKFDFSFTNDASTFVMGHISFLGMMS